MNKVLHVLVYVFLALAAAALYFELQLNAKRSLLTDRNRLQEDYIIKIAKTIESAEPSKDAAFEIKKDNSPVEAKIVDSPDMENVLNEYPGALEQANLDTFNWDGQAERSQLRQVYAMDFDGQPIMDGNQPLMRGKGTEDELLSKLFESAKAQQSRLNTTRAALADMRAKLESLVAEINKLKPEARQDKITIEEQKVKLAKLEDEKGAIESRTVKTKGQIDELNGEIASLKNEVNTSKEEAEAAREETAKAQKLIDQLKKLLQESIQTQGSASAGSGTAITSISAGDKGRVIEADNENMFAIVEFAPDAMKELRGDNGKIPSIDIAVKRPGYKGSAGEFIGKLHLRQEITGKNYVICDILGSWEQGKVNANDIIFAD